MNTVVFERQLSNYEIFDGEMSGLNPRAPYIQYELNASLYKGESKKQRLVKIPEGTQIDYIDEKLPNFPNGTIIVKTFYYFLDARDESLGKRIIETRLMIKENDVWSVAAYLWNDTQTEADLIESGWNTVVNFIDETGQPNIIAYHVPNNRECATCHLVSDKVKPIGPKIRNLNKLVNTEFGSMNQLSYFQDMGILASFDVETTIALPNYQDESVTNEERARAYLEINCAHCHSSEGTASDEVYLNYLETVNPASMKENKAQIRESFESGEMPYIGTSTVDKEGLEIILNYLNEL